MRALQTSVQTQSRFLCILLRSWWLFIRETSNGDLESCSLASISKRLLAYSTALELSLPSMDNRHTLENSTKGSLLGLCLNSVLSCSLLRDRKISTQKLQLYSSLKTAFCITEALWPSFFNRNVSSLVFSALPFGFSVVLHMQTVKFSSEVFISAKQSWSCYSPAYQHT